MGFSTASECIMNFPLIPWAVNTAGGRRKRRKKRNFREQRCSLKLLCKLQTVGSDPEEGSGSADSTRVWTLDCGGEELDHLDQMNPLLPADPDVMERESDQEARRKIQFSVPSTVALQLDPRQVELVSVGMAGRWLI